MFKLQCPPLLCAAAFAFSAHAAAQAPNYCLSFDGIDDAVAVTRSLALEPAEITIEMWARLDGPQDWNSRLLRKGLDDAYFITADQDFDQHMQLLINRGHSIVLTAEDPQPHTAYIGTWHHFTGVYAIDHAAFWVDGVKVSSVTHDLGALTHLPLTDLYIGAGLPVPLQNEYFAGRIDEVRIWNYPRTDAQVLASWFASVSPSEPGLVACWQFDEGSGQVAHDATSFGHDGRLGGTPAVEPSDPTWVLSDAPIGSGTQAGHCLSFNGVEDFVVVPRSLSLEPDEITIEMWAYLDGPQDWNSRLLRKGELAAYFITADMDLDQRMQILVTKAQPGVRISAKDTQPHTAYIGAWHHFLGVYATDHAEFWVDGVQKSSVTHDLGALTHMPLTDLYIGAGLPVPMPNEYFAGRIDEVRIWNYPRSAAEIQATWNREATGSEPGLVACWKFNEGAGQVAHDSSAIGNHGQLGATSSPESSDPDWMVSDLVFGTPNCSGVNFCDSTVNSSGNAAVISSSGSLSISQNDMQLNVSGAPAARPGLFIYGRGQFHAALGNGFLCISPFSPGLFRLPPGVVIGSAGTANHQVDFALLPTLGQITPGSTWLFQFWFRDPPAGGGGTNLSNGLEATFCP